MLRSFEVALAFLTIFDPHPKTSPTVSDVGRSAWAFPVVGALMGLLLVVVRWFCAPYFSPLLVAILLVALWMVLTGGLHIDGWTDCWDALAAAVPPERRLEILKDSRLGTFGALGLVLLLALKAAALADEKLPIFMVFLAPIVGRASMLLVAHRSSHRGEGMAARFIDALDTRVVKWVAILVCFVALVAGWHGILAVGVAYGGALLFRRFAEARLNMVNGDVIGASCELSETLVLLIGCMRV
ncbi:MAG: adenosylcobinamide-GDP ribazoletransferase [Thermodesulfobacteriota bacterium]